MELGLAGAVGILPVYEAKCREETARLQAKWRDFSRPLSVIALDMLYEVMRHCQDDRITSEVRERIFGNQVSRTTLNDFLKNHKDISPHIAYNIICCCCQFFEDMELPVPYIDVFSLYELKEYIWLLNLQTSLLASLPIMTRLDSLLEEAQASGQPDREASLSPLLESPTVSQETPAIDGLQSERLDDLF